MGDPLSPPCQQKNLPRAADYGDKKLETTAALWYTGAMPRRFRDYLNRLSRRNAPEQRTISMPVQATNPTYRVWSPANDLPPSRVWHHDMDNPRTDRELTQQMLENVYNNMTTQEVFETADRNNDNIVPENMLRLVRLSMPEINGNRLVEERPMDPPNDLGGYLNNRSTMEQLFNEYMGTPNRGTVYSEYTPSWSNEVVTYTPYYSSKAISWHETNWCSNKMHVEYRRGKIIRVKRFCKI